ncbi:hypothetical protein GGR51DRAFT_330816 [Nemania sp. FL0031]|nr:hypothetical protein GGR51DRAFT_330816 [Nemania sp. FL0031]
MEGLTSSDLLENEDHYARETPNDGSDYWVDHSEHDSSSNKDDGPQTSVDVRNVIAHTWGNELLNVTHEGGILNATEEDVRSSDDEDDGRCVYEKLDTDPLRLIELAMHAPSPLGGLDIDTLYNRHVPSLDDERANQGAQPIRKDGEKRDSTMTNEAGTAAAPGVSFAKLQESSLSHDTFSLNHLYERAHWRILELVEVKETVERELQEAAKHYKSLKKEVSTGRQNFRHKAETLGISKELWDAYEAFCESMEPQFGSEEGFSIICDKGHGGSYVEYDPELLFYKQFSERDWRQHNFRCEASKSRLVEFWPVPSVALPLFESDIGEDDTWGEEYPQLYELATEAARNGSEAAIDMLVALPDREASSKGGWLFEYSTIDRSTYPAESTHGYGLVEAQNPVKSRRWAYRSAHRVDSPEDATTKRESIRAALDLEGDLEGWMI